MAKAPTACTIIGGNSLPTAASTTIRPSQFEENAKQCCKARQKMSEPTGEMERKQSAAKPVQLA